MPHASPALKSLKPDIVAPITRATTAILLLEDWPRQRVETMAVFSPGTPGLFEAEQIAQLREQIEYVLDCVPWPNFRNPRIVKVAEEYARRSGGRHFDTNGGYSDESNDRPGAHVPLGHMVQRCCL